MTIICLLDALGCGIVRTALYDSFVLYFHTSKYIWLYYNCTILRTSNTSRFPVWRTGSTERRRLQHTSAQHGKEITFYGYHAVSSSMLSPHCSLWQGSPRMPPTALEGDLLHPSARQCRCPHCAQPLHLCRCEGHYSTPPPLPRPPTRHHRLHLERSLPWLMASHYRTTCRRLNCCCCRLPALSSTSTNVHPTEEEQKNVGMILLLASSPDEITQTR